MAAGSRGCEESRMNIAAADKPYTAAKNSARRNAGGLAQPALRQIEPGGVGNLDDSARAKKMAVVARLEGPMPFTGKCRLWYSKANSVCNPPGTSRSVTAEAPAHTTKQSRAWHHVGTSNVPVSSMTDSKARC